MLASDPWATTGLRTASTYASASRFVSASPAARRSCDSRVESAIAPRARTIADTTRKALSRVSCRPRPCAREPRIRRMAPVSARTRRTLRPSVQSAAVDLDVVFLGTSGSTPTAKRGLAATLVRRGGDRLLFDCGEGTQRQLLRSDVGLLELEEIFLTHFHADHYLGLPGLLKTYALRGRELPLTLYGPAGLRELLATLRRIFGRLTYPVEAVELEPGERLERGE